MSRQGRPAEYLGGTPVCNPIAVSMIGGSKGATFWKTCLFCWCSESGIRDGRSQKSSATRLPAFGRPCYMGLVVLFYLQGNIGASMRINSPRHRFGVLPRFWTSTPARQHRPPARTIGDDESPSPPAGICPKRDLSTWPHHPPGSRKCLEFLSYVCFYTLIRPLGYVLPSGSPKSWKWTTTTCLAFSKSSSDCSRDCRFSISTQQSRDQGTVKPPTPPGWFLTLPGSL